MDHLLLEKYASEKLPRYTSYPTAPHFVPGFDPSLHYTWISEIPKGHPVSLYVHVPFCRAMCWYCGCHTKVSRREAPVISYVASLDREIQLVAKHINQAVTVRHLHFGGGTPTIIGARQFTDVMKRIRSHFEFDANAEIAIEVDPRVLEVGMAHTLSENGVNRVSLGIQSFDPKVQQAINRVQPFEQSRQVAHMIREAGINSLNLDLIYGLPRQTTRSVTETALQALDLQPDRLSVFGYAHVPTFKKHQKMINESELPETCERLEQFDAIQRTLVSEGFIQIGIDHFAAPDDELATSANLQTLHRNFQGYTTDTCDTLIGLGASAISKFPQGYVQNHTSVGLYTASLKDGGLPSQRGLQLTDEDRIRSEVIERLMCDYEVDFANLTFLSVSTNDVLADALGRLAPLIENGFVQHSGTRLTVSKEHRFIVRKVASCFDAYLGSVPVSHSRAA